MFDRKTFFDAVRTPVFGGHVSQQQVEGLTSLLDEWEKRPPSDDLRFLAYCLGTAFWETGKTLQPVEEIGKGRSHAYGNPAGPWHQVYDGRGDVQLTWLANYTKATARLHAAGLLDSDLNLAETPTLAMRPDLAAAILYLGCIEGWFTGKKLGDYLTSATSDWVNARRVVNGTDHATTIAGYSMNFLPALQRASEVGAVAQAIPAAEPAPEAAQPSPIAPGAPSSAPAGDHSTTAESKPTMNPITSMLTGAKLFSTVAPAVLKAAGSAVTHISDIEAKGKSLVSGLEKAFDDFKHLDIASAEADLGAAWKAGMAIYDDVGLPRDLVDNVVAQASTTLPSLSGLSSLESMAGSLIKAFGG